MTICYHLVAPSESPDLAKTDDTNDFVTIKVAFTDSGTTSHEDALLQWEAELLSR